MKGKRIYNILACCAIAWAFSACADVWEEHYQADKPISGQDGNTDDNLWDLISSDKDLEEFAALLEATGYDTLLTKNRSYTVWAPIDGAGFIDLAILKDAKSEKLDIYKKEIVENHIANFVHPASGIRDKEDRKNYETIEMLNTKRYDFEGGTQGSYTFEGLELKASNIVAKNGMLHKLDGYVGFAANIWEQLAKEPSISMLWEFLKKDYKREFNPNASVQGPVVDGLVTWLDSAFTESCRWFSEIGWLAREDSSYTMYALTDRAWQEMYESTSKYFDFSHWTKNTLPSKGNQTAEEARDSIVYNLMCRNLVFSNTINKKFYEGKRDTLISNAYSRQIFVDEEAHALSEGTIEGYPITLSNGRLYVVDEVNYNPFTCWFDTIRIEGESLSDANDKRFGFKDAFKRVSSIHRDSVLYDKVSGHAVGVYEGYESGVQNPTFNFYANNLLSAHYRVKIVLIPPHILNPLDTTFIKPNKFTARLFNGSTVNLAAVDAVDGDNVFVSDSSKIDTIVLFDCFKMPYCDYQTKALIDEESTMRLEVASDIYFTGSRGEGENKGSKRESSKWNYDNHFRIDQVIFEPIIPKSE